MDIEIIQNGQGAGSLATALLNNNMDAGALRPYHEGGRSYVTLNRNGKSEVVVCNANATLRKDEWKLLDERVMLAAKQRLQAVADVRGRGLQYVIPNGMGTTVFQTEAQSDISAAEINMEGVNQTKGDRPQYSLSNLPMPIISKDFQISARQLAASRNGNTPLDTSMASAAARVVSEAAEKLLLGKLSTYTFGGGTVYGLTNFTSRLTKSLTDPTGSAWTGATLVQEVLQMRKQAQDAYHYGPYIIYAAPAWDVYLDDDYSAAKGDMTLRQRLEQISGIEAVRTSDFLTDYDFVMVQMTEDVVRMIVGMDVTTIQWSTNGGLTENFKVMSILVPQVRADYNGNTGIVHGSVA